jgi:hypothetical protein
MTDRISIPALRDKAEGGALPAPAKPGWDVLLALVEAVEALEAIRALPSRSDLLLNAEARAMYEIANIALARFDFGEET